MRRGAYADFDPTKMLPGEWAVVLSGDDTTDGYAVYICYAAGTVKRLVSEDEISALPDNVKDMVLAELEPDIAAMQSATSTASSIIAPVENGKASKSYAVGSYLMRGGKLYRVTSAIASGNNITPGTNVSETTVMAELVSRMS